MTSRIIPSRLIAIPTTIVCNADLPEDFVYIVTKTIYESGYYKDSFKATEARGWPSKSATHRTFLR